MTLFFGMFFGAIGSAYLVYAKRQQSVSFLIAGFLLIVYTYFFDSAWAIILIGIVLLGLPFAIDRGML